MRTRIVLMLLFCFSFGLNAQKRSYDIAAFVYPAYAADDPRLRPFWPMGMGEWETVMNMQSRYPPDITGTESLFGAI